MRSRIVAVLLITFSVACYGKCSWLGEGGSGPSPQPSATPTPTATPTPSVSPTPTPTPNPFLCALAPSTAAQCGAPALPQLEARVAGVQSTLIPGSSEAAYVAALVAGLRALGLCATSGGGIPSDEIAIKVSNTYSETYDVWNASNFPQLLYKGTCTPARF